MNKIIVFTLLFFSYITLANASAWPRGKGELFTILEGSLSASHTEYFFRDLDIEKESNYKTLDLKLYAEYGISNTLTISGYIKNNRVELIKEQNVHWDIKNNYYSHLALNHNFYTGNNFVLSHSIAGYLPVKNNEDYASLNYLDSKDSVAYYIFFGLNNSKPIDQVFDVSEGFFLSSKFGYRKVFDSFYDVLETELTLGLKNNPSSMFLIQYIGRYDFYQDTNFQKVRRKGKNNKKEDLAITTDDNYYLSASSNKIKLSSVIAFKDDLSVEFSYTKILGNSNVVYGSTIAVGIWKKFKFF